MRVLTAYQTDVGNQKDTNEDSLCIQVAETDRGIAIFAAVCDGMGGLSKGELASATVIRALEAWFEEDFPALLGHVELEDEIRYQWDRIIKEQNRLIGAYGRAQSVHIGTTLTAMLILEDRLFIGHVGDTRAYRLDGEGIRQLTEDHTVVNQKIQHGQMTQDEAEGDARRHMLLQCIGASKVLTPDFVFDRVRPGECYLLCSDGFPDKITTEEMAQTLAPDTLVDEAVMEAKLRTLIDMDMQRGEEDNITAIMIKLEEG
ncbi:protein phosphatase 2C domain-containing protein [Eubacteriales bacterium OttesenSCG-928-M02]|nr:protein phosphatase 2C domain-containing protein [Eubacteriales bacterium OttesenSCG-928-M02]